MPELPEVETITEGLNKKLKDHPVIEQIIFYRDDIRSPIPKTNILKLKKEKILKVFRRAKYIIFSTPKGSILSHLGMTGHWRLDKENHKQKHDHFAILLSNKKSLIFNDPRRFGYVGFLPLNGKHEKLNSLGPEPLSNNFTLDYLKLKLESKNLAIKSAIMDQKLVVGVGNIYACEALFKSKINPNRKAKSLNVSEVNSLVKAIKDVLAAAIKAGGSTIRDYKTVDSENGGFQENHFVYNRKAMPCKICKTPIKMNRLGGRSTYWCPICQK